MELIIPGLRVPFEADGEAAYRYEATESDRFDLPGLWLSSEELYALLASQQLLRRTGGGGMLSTMLAPLQQRNEGLLAAQVGSGEIRIESPGTSTGCPPMIEKRCRAGSRL